MTAGSSLAIDQPIIKRRPWSEWLAAALILLLMFYAANLLIGNSAFSWQVVFDFLFEPTIVRGAWVTFKLTLMIMAFSILVGTLVALMRMSQNPIILGASWLFLWLFRSIPVIVWLLFWYFFAAFMPSFQLGIPWGPTFFEIDTNILIGQTGAVILGLGLTEAAYMAEIIRGGILSVNVGQRDAALALGMTRQQTLFGIILPQALKTMLPSIGNQFIATLKATSIVLIIGVPDLMTSVQNIYNTNYLQIPLLMVACIWYLVMTSLLAIAQHQLERYANRGNAAYQPARGNLL